MLSDLRLVQARADGLGRLLSPLFGGRADEFEASGVIVKPGLGCAAAPHHPPINLRTIFNRDRVVGQITRNPCRFLNRQHRRAHRAVNTAAKRCLVGNDVAAHPATGAKDQHVATNITVDIAVEMNVATAADIASDGHFTADVGQRARAALCRRGRAYAARIITLDRKSVV